MRCFGLEVHIQNTRFHEQTIGKDSPVWQNYDDYHGEWIQPLQTTIIYLTLPKKTVREEMCITEGEGESSSFDIDCAHSMLVDYSQPRTQGFKRAMKMLGLRPFVHPSQLRSSVATYSTKQDTVQKDEDLPRHTSESRTRK